MVEINMHRNRTSAFTLIELLVVIAIIAILAAILFPVFAQAKLAAKKAVDLSNMKQIGLSLYMYANDYDDTTPQVSYEFGAPLEPVAPYNPDAKYQIHFTFLLQPYIKNYDIFLAPADPNPVTPSNPCPNGAADFGKLDASGQMYCDWQATNSYIPAYNVLPAHDWLPVPFTTFPTPANMIAMADRRFKNLAPTPVVFSGKKGLSGFNPSQPCTQEGAVMVAPQYDLMKAGDGKYAFWTADQIQQHILVDKNDKVDVTRVWYDLYGNGSNYAFADGHAKYQSLGQTLIPQLGQYEYGDTFYPSINPQEGASCLGGG
ncbi:MAG TPA: prepilin-type N-terminal cleavage/methylation domain-containing protein [Fimbriimonas sp.]|nr:prepilin-type N-terminal cleavage/methylation domain-containing protein [Fimbriimonas sp.]